MIYTDAARVQKALGPSVATDAYLDDCVDAANATVARKRAEAGYDDAPDPEPAPADAAMGATLFAVALWRERASADSYQSFDELAGSVLVGGAWPQIKRLLGIPRGRVDAPMSYADAAERRRAILFPPAVTP